MSFYRPSFEVGLVDVVRSPGPAVTQETLTEFAKVSPNMNGFETVVKVNAQAPSDFHIVSNDSIAPGTALPVLGLTHGRRHGM